MLHKTIDGSRANVEDEILAPTYGLRQLADPIPKYMLPKEEMSAAAAYQLIRDELMLDGNSRLNLATFVTTWMEPEARQLMTETFDKNMVDKDEYPQTAEIEKRCVNIMARLFHAPGQGEACGCSTVGSSEAVMLGGMALKWKWRERMKAKGRPTDKPNLVLGMDVQVCWEKFCRYWDIEPRFIPMEPGRYCINAEEVIKRIDENTMGVVGILGTTFTGQYEPIEEIDAALEEFNAKTGYNVPIHVDAASGGFIAPFLQPHLKWDFRLKWVKSINTSGHKYGLVYPGVGWVVWRDKSELPDDLVFKVNYLGGEMPTFEINFSRPGNQVVAQYYNFLRLGHMGYRRIQSASQRTARHLAEELKRIGPFEMLSDGSDIPVIAFRIKEDAKVNYSVFDLSEAVRHNGWLIPAYTLPNNVENIAVLRIVVKEGFSRDMADMLVSDFERIIHYLQKVPGRKPRTSSVKGKTRKHC